MSNCNETLFKVIQLAKRITDETLHEVSVEYSGKRDEVTVYLYRDVCGMYSRGSFEAFSTTEYKLQTIYSILMDLAYEHA